MNKPVSITPITRADLDNASLYLITSFGLKVLENFLALYEARIASIAEQPDRYPIINKELKLRKAVLTKHNIILYREMTDKIEVISIFDTRQDPGKIDKLSKSK